MMRWSCQRLHGCVPVPAEREAAGRARHPCSWLRRSCHRRRRGGEVGRSGRCAPRPWTRSARRRCSVRGRSPWRGREELFEAVRRARGSRGSRSANSSSTASVKSVPDWNSAWFRSEELLARRRAARHPCPAEGSREPRQPTGGEQPLRDFGPRPARDGRPARGGAQLVAARRGSSEDLPQAWGAAPRRFRSRTPRGGAAARRVGRLEPGRDLGEARVARDERRGARSGGLRGEHPERLREDRRHDRASASGSRCTRWRCSSGPVKSVAAAPPPRARRGRRRTRPRRARASTAAIASRSTCTPFFSISFPK